MEATREGDRQVLTGSLPLLFFLKDIVSSVIISHRRPILPQHMRPFTAVGLLVFLVHRDTLTTTHLPRYYTSNTRSSLEVVS